MPEPHYNREDLYRMLKAYGYVYVTPPGGGEPVKLVPEEKK